MTKSVLATRAAMAALLMFGIGTAAAQEAPNFNPDKIATDPALAAKLPEQIAKAGVLVIGSDTSYAPWEYISEKDGKTPEGIDVDLAEAMAKTLGLKLDFRTSAFDAILPALGAKYDIGMSAFSISNERMKAVNFVSYSQTGALWAVKAGNPAGFEADKLCGRNVAIQSGSFFQRFLQEENQACAAAGKPAIEMIPFATQAEALTRVAAGGADATVSGSATIGYASKQSNGRLVTMRPAGKLGGFGLNGIAVSKNDMALTELIAEVTNKLIADGVYKEIYGMWGIDDSNIPLAEINPKVKD